MSAGYFAELLAAAHGHSLNGLTAATASLYVSSGLLGLKKLLTRTPKALAATKALPAPVEAAAAPKALPLPGYVEEAEKQKNLVVELLKECSAKTPAATKVIGQAEGKLSRDLVLFKGGVIKRDQWEASIAGAISVLDNYQAAP